MKRILVSIGQHLIAAALESLLLREADVDILCTSLMDGKAFYKKIETYQPNVVLIDERILNGDLAKLLSLMDCLSELVIVVVNSDSNQMYLYTKKMISLTHSSDLIAVIRGS